MVNLSILSSESFSQSADGMIFVFTLLISQALLFTYVFHKMWKKSAEYEQRLLSDADFYCDSPNGLPISQYPAVVSMRAREIHLGPLHGKCTAERSDTDQYPVTVKSSDNI